jgi:hypothetical protein
MPHGACVTSEDHPADANQGRGLDHLAGPSYFSSVVWWLIAGALFCLLAMAQVLMGGPHEQ